MNLPKLTEEQKQTTEEPISLEEFHKAFNQTPNNKAPGPDGFPAEFTNISGQYYHHSSIN